MRMNDVKILSIDWDYFQNVKKEIIRKCYPDGIDMPTDLSTIIWASKYAAFPDLKQNATLRADEYQILTKILKKQSTAIPVTIVNSHMYAYDFVKNISDKHHTKIELVNVDMHHDIVNNNDELDCGNWIQHLIENHYIKSPIIKSLKWINHPISFDTYGFLDPDDSQEFKDVIEKINGGTSLSVIENETFDGIFIARSDNWSPPHLDGYFNKLIKHIFNHFTEVIIEKSVETQRSEYKQITENIRTNYREVLNKK